jgi:hypothetical protein
MDRARKHAPVVTEAGVLAYLVGLPMGQSLAPVARELSLLTIAVGMLLSRIPICGQAPRRLPYRFVIPFALFALSALASAVFSSYPALSLSRAAYAPIAFLLFLAVQDVETSGAAFRRLFITLSVVVWLLGLDGVVSVQWVRACSAEAR